MIDDIDRLGRAWGKHMRSRPNGWHTENWIAQEENRQTGHSRKSAITSSDDTAYSPAGIDRRVGRRYGHVTDGFKYSGLRDGESSGLNMHREYEHGDSRITAYFGTLDGAPSGEKNNFKIYQSIIPIKRLMSKEALRFHRALKNLHIYDQAILWTHYVLDVLHDRKVGLLKTTNDKYPKWLEHSRSVIAREIERLDVEFDFKAFAPKPVTKKIDANTTPLWPCRIFSYVHKVAIHASIRDPFPICLSLTGHNNLKSPFTKPDTNIYCFHPNGDVYAVLSPSEWIRLRRQGRISSYLDERRSFYSDRQIKRVCNG